MALSNQRTFLDYINVLKPRETILQKKSGYTTIANKISALCYPAWGWLWELVPELSGALIASEQGFNIATVVDMVNQTQ